MMAVCADGLLCLVAPSWLLWIVAGFILNGVVYWKHLLPAVLRGVMEYGKLRIGESKSGLNYYLTVPKRWFTHFYIWAVIWNYFLFSVYTYRCIFQSDISIPILGSMIDTLTGGLFQHQCTDVSQHHFNVFIVLLLLCFQVTRRLYECLCVSVFSSSRMHMVHYALGLYFYTAVGPTVLLHLQSASLEKSSSISQEGISFGHYLSWYHILAIALFLWAGWHQYKCHKILADLRKTKPSSNAPTSSDRKPPNSDQPPTINQPPDGGGGGKREEVVGPKYAMPVGDWFRYVSCPHLFAEILIYVALLLCQLFSEPVCTWWLVVVHVTGSLYLSARQMHNWYLEKFEDYPKNRTSLFPGLF